MLTLSYGFYKMETGDRGSVWFPAIETNFQNLNDHTHNGTNSAFIAPSSIAKFTSSVSSASWSGSAGTYTQTITVPAGISGAATYNDISNYSISVLNSSGDRLYPTITRTSATQFVISVNDNTLNLTILYV